MKNTIIMAIMMTFVSTNAQADTTKWMPEQSAHVYGSKHLNRESGLRPVRIECGYSPSGVLMVRFHVAPGPRRWFFTTGGRGFRAGYKIVDTYQKSGVRCDLAYKED